MAVTASSLSALSQQMPGQNQRVAQGLQEAARTQMKQQMAGQGPMGVQQVQAIGQQVAAQKGQATLQAQQQGAQQAEQMGKLALNQEQQDKQVKLQARQLDLAKKSRQNTEMLNSLDSRLKTELLDSQYQFQQDELGRTLFNDRQLADYKIQTAKSDLELRDFEDKTRQLSARRIQLLKSAQARLEQDMKQEFSKGQQKLDQEMTRRMAEAKRQLEEKIRKEQAKQANRASMFSAGGSLLVGGAAFVLSGFNPMAGMAGAQIGAGLGTAAYGTTR